MKILMARNLNNNLVCAYNSDLDLLKKLKLNEIIEVEIKRKRNIRFHKKFMALIELLFQNQEIYTDKDDLRYDLTIEAGHYELRANIHGEEVKKAKSISFASMDETEFSELYNSVIDVIVKYFNFDKQDIINNINQYF